MILNRFISVIQGLARASLVLYVVTDLLVALLLCYFLHSSRTGIKRYGIPHRGTVKLIGGLNVVIAPTR